MSRTLATPEQVSERSRERVMQIVAETGYTPNMVARNLRARRTMTVLVIVPNVGGAFWPEVLRSMDDALVEGGYDLIIGHLDNLVEREERYVNLAAAGQVDGVLIMSGCVPMGRERSMADLGIPMVSVNALIPNFDSPHVVVNDREAAATIAEHLLSLGHRRFGYVSGPAGNANDGERRIGFFGNLLQAGIDEADVTIWPGSYSYEAGVRAGEMFLAMNRRPTAIFATCDEAAISFMKTVRGGGLDIPKDVSVVGFDGIAAAAYTEPTLTTVHQPCHQIGHVAVRALIDLMAGKEVPSRPIELKAPLIIAGTTGPPSVSGGP